MCLIPNTTVTDVIEKHLPKMVTKQSAKSANTKIHCNLKSTCFGVIMRQNQVQIFILPVDDGGFIHISTSQILYILPNKVNNDGPNM